MASPSEVKDDTTAPPAEHIEQTQVQDEAAEQQYDPNAWASYYDPRQDINAQTDYANIGVNGVLPEHGLQGEHLQQEHLGEHGYVPTDEYGGVAATLSNWAEANADGSVLVPQPNTGLEHQSQNGELHQQGQMQEKPKKLVLACHFCRGRKLKCDGERPACGHCVKRNQNCTYDEAVRRRGPGKRTKEMRERAAREAEAAQLGIPPEQLAHLTGTPSTLAEAAPKRPGRKRKHDAYDAAEKKARLEENMAAYSQMTEHQLSEHQLAEHQLSEHHLGEHQLGEHHLGEHQLGDHQLGDHQLSEHQLAEHQLAEHQLGEHQLSEHQLAEHHLGEHQLGDVDPTQHGLEHLPSHDQLIDPSLTENAGVLDLPPLEPGTLGQVIQQLNGQGQ